MKISLAFHILGIVFWMAGLLFLTKTRKINVSTNPEVAVLNRKLTFGWLVPGMLITFVTGAYQFLYMGAAYYMQQGWFHAKLTILLVLFAASFYLLIKGEKVPQKHLTIIHAFAASALLIISILTTLGK